MGVAPESSILAGFSLTKPSSYGGIPMETPIYNPVLYCSCNSATRDALAMAEFDPQQRAMKAAGNHDQLV